jgi:hypothetical protein
MQNTEYTSVQTNLLFVDGKNLPDTFLTEADSAGLRFRMINHCFLALT